MSEWHRGFLVAVSFKTDNMKVKIKTNIVGPLGNFKKGKVCEVNNETAKELLKCDFAEAIEEQQPIEKAVNTPKATTRKTKAKK